MAVPYMARALRGWVKWQDVQLITKTVSNGLVSVSKSLTKLKMNKQSMPPQQVDRKPPEQREWIWRSIIVQEGPILRIDDKIIIKDKKFVIQKVYDWSESGFQKYEAIEGFNNG